MERKGKGLAFAGALGVVGVVAVGEPEVNASAFEDKGIVVAVFGPRTVGDVREFYKFPITDVFAFEAEVIADGGGNVEASALVEVWEWSLVAEDVLPMIGAEGAAVFPLGVGDAVAVADGDPPAFADGFAFAFEGMAEPGNNAAGFGFGGAHSDVVVGESDVKGILAGDELDGDVVSAVSGVGVVVAAVVFDPIGIPGAFMVGCGVVGRGLFANPEDGGDDVAAPGVAGKSGGKGLGVKNLGLESEDLLAADLLSKVFEVGRGGKKGRRDGVDKKSEPCQSWEARAENALLHNRL